MERIFSDEQKIGFFATVQRNLKKLKPYSSDDSIDQIINEIPPTIFTKKDDFMVLCSLFAYYARNSFYSHKINGFKLFNRIIPHMKNQLHDESNFLWQIFGDCLYYKLWMHDEGLISIEQIVQSAQLDNSGKITKYFLPEIIDEVPEIYEKQIKYQINKKFTQLEIEDFKESRKKYFIWLQKSCNFHDPLYQEIEKNKLRLAIKMDDINTFQKILSNSNISVNVKIEESIIENNLLISKKCNLIEYAVLFNSKKIFNFLIMNNAKLTESCYFYSMLLDDYDIFHIIEEKIPGIPVHTLALYSYHFWKNEMTEYIYNNYNYSMMTQDDDKIVTVITQIYRSMDFNLLETVMIPYFKQNQDFLNKNIMELAVYSTQDHSCYFLNEYMKHPGIEINSIVEECNLSLIGSAIKYNNTKAVEIIMKQPNIDINGPAFCFFTPLHIVMHSFADTKIVEMISSHPDFDVNFVDFMFDTTGFGTGVHLGNIYSIKYLTENFDEIDDIPILMYKCLKKNYKMTLKIIFKFFIEKQTILSINNIILLFFSIYHKKHSFKEEYIEELRDIAEEITSQKVNLPSEEEKRKIIECHQRNENGVKVQMKHHVKAPSMDPIKKNEARKRKSKPRIRMAETPKNVPQKIKPRTQNINEEKEQPTDIKEGKIPIKALDLQENEKGLKAPSKINTPKTSDNKNDANEQKIDQKHQDNTKNDENTSTSQRQTIENEELPRVSNTNTNRKKPKPIITKPNVKSSQFH